MSCEADQGAIIVSGHPTEDDYLHAQAAHGAIWARVVMKKRGWRKQSLHISLMVLILGLVVAPLVLSRCDLGLKQWHVEPLPIIAEALLFPAFVVVMAIALMSTAGPTPDIGIVEDTPQALEKLHAARRRGWLGWMLFISLAVLLFILTQRQRPAPRAAPAAAPPARYVTDDVELPPTLDVPASLILIGSLVAAAISFQFLALVQRRQRRRQIALMHDRLGPRQWEFTEEHCLERSEDCITQMTWPYIRKFLETPQAVLLYPQELLFYLIPRSAFGDEIQYAQFIGLLMRKIPNGVIQPRAAQGFAVHAVPVIPVDSDTK